MASDRQGLSCGKAEEKQRGGALPRAQSVPSGMGVEEPSLLVTSKKVIGDAGNVEVQHFPLSLEPTNAEMELSITCAHGESVSPAEAAVFFLDVSPHMIAELAV